MINCAWQERSTENEEGWGEGVTLQAASCDAKSAIMQQREIFVAFASHVRERNLRSVESSLEKEAAAAQAEKKNNLFAGSGFGFGFWFGMGAQSLRRNLVHTAFAQRMKEWRLGSYPVVYLKGVYK